MEWSCLEKTLMDLRVSVLLRHLGDDADLHLVGGSLRDALLGTPPSDLDFASALPPQEILERLNRASIRTIPTGLKHQTVTCLPIPDASSVEITSFRGPGMRKEGGVVLGSSFAEDAKYRDFTINALGYSFRQKKIIDPVNGLADLEQFIIRAVGDPAERFTEDPLRVLRMVRFACRNNFSLDPHTEESSKRFAGQISALSIERVRDEFSGIILSDNPSKGLRMLLELGFLEKILPEVAQFSGFEQNNYHYVDLFEHTLEVLEKTPRDLLVRLSALLHDVGKPATLSIDSENERHFYKHESVGSRIAVDMMERLRYPRELTRQVSTLVATHMRPISAGPGGLRRLLRDTNELFPAWRALKQADATSVRLEREKLITELEDFDRAIERIKNEPDVSPLKSLAVNGTDLLALGFTPGPIIGETLRSLHDHVLDNPQENTREILLELAKLRLRSQPGGYQN